MTRLFLILTVVLSYGPISSQAQTFKSTRIPPPKSESAEAEDASALVDSLEKNRPGQGIKVAADTSESLKTSIQFLSKYLKEDSSRVQFALEWASPSSRNTLRPQAQEISRLRKEVERAKKELETAQEGDEKAAFQRIRADVDSLYTRAKTLVQNREQALEAGREPPKLIAAVQLEGNVKTAYEENEDGPATGLVGGEFIRPRTQYVWTARVGVAQTQETVSGGFATSILVPGTGGDSFESGYLHCSQALRTRYSDWSLWNHLPYVSCFSNAPVFAEDVSRNWRPYFYATGGRQTWTATPQGASQEQTNGVSVYGFGMGMQRYLIPPASEDNSEQSADNSFDLSIEFGLLSRWISVDGTADNRDAFLTGAIGGDSNTFVGFETGLTVAFNQLVAQVQIYRFPSAWGARGVDPLSGTQLTAGLSVSIDTFRLTRADPAN